MSSTGLYNLAHPMNQLTLILALCLIGAHTAVGAQAKQLNVVLIMADDSAVDNYGCYGSTYFKTPRLDALAGNGVRFTQCYSEPVCTASRCKIMTGRDNIRNYTFFGNLDANEITFGTMMKQAGYATAVAGKWQLHYGNSSRTAASCGFDNYCLWNYPGATGSRYWQPNIMQDGTKLQTTSTDYGPDIFTDYLINFIAKNKSRPFFAYYPMVLVHSPYEVTPDSKSPVGSIGKFVDMTLYADKCVGRIVDALDQHGLRDNTVLIFTTDNGTGRGLSYPYKNEIRKGEKAYATDGGTHVPLIVSCPGTVAKGLVTDDLIDFSDMLPTIANIAGAPLPNVKLDGRSFWPQCQGQAGNPRQWIFQYYYPKWKNAAPNHTFNGYSIEGHGQGFNNNEIVWAQDQYYKLYRDGSLYATSDRLEILKITPGTSQASDDARKLLQGALNSMPTHAEKLKDLVVKMRADRTDVSISDPGTQTLTIDMGTPFANQYYWIVGSATGIQPPIQVGTVALPLTFDSYTSMLMGSPNTLVQNSLARLSTAGKASARFVLPMGVPPVLVGLKLWHAFVTFDASGAPTGTSNAIPLRLSK